MEVSSVSARHAVDPTLAKIAERVEIALTKNNVLNVVVKIIVIGAGAAGLTAGHLLEQRGIEFEILEAAPIYGGRVRKLEGFADFPIDLGAEWIHRWTFAAAVVVFRGH